MIDSPLDIPTGSTPSGNDRPASQWIENQWMQTAPWAKRFAFAIWAYVSWEYFSTIKYFTSDSEIDAKLIGILLGVFLIYCPVIVLGYFSFRFGKNLEKALAQRDQILLEKAFVQLYRFLILGLIIAIFWTTIVALQYLRVFYQSAINMN